MVNIAYWKADISWRAGVRCSGEIGGQKLPSDRPVARQGGIMVSGSRTMA